MGSVSIETPLETSARGGQAIPVIVQDATTGVLDLPFLRQINTTSIVADTVVNANTLTLAPGHGTVAGNSLEIADLTNGSWFMQSTVLGVAGDVVTIATPINRIYTVANSSVVIANRAMNVVGTAATPVIYSVDPLPIQSGDIIRLICTMTDNVAMDFEKFGGLAKLTNGVVVRVNNGDGTYRVIQNFKSNGDIERYAFDRQYFENNGGGVRGFSARMTFGGWDKHGVVIRLDGSLGEKLEIVIQDDLRDLLSMGWIAQGSEIQN